MVKNIIVQSNINLWQKKLTVEFSISKKEKGASCENYGAYAFA